jgi:tetratricopeptide (TPR) repeat protein
MNSLGSKAGRVIVAQANIQQADDLVNRGNAHAYRKEYDRAIAAFSEAIKLDPKYAYAYNSRADTLREAGKAAQDRPMPKALQLDSGNADFGIRGPRSSRRWAAAGGDRGLQACAELDANMTETRERLKRLDVSP